MQHYFITFREESSKKKSNSGIYSYWLTPWPGALKIHQVTHDLREYLDEVKKVLLFPMRKTMWVL